MRLIELASRIRKIAHIQNVQSVPALPINTNLRSKAERKLWNNQINAHKKKWVPPVKSAISAHFKTEGSKVSEAYRITGSQTATTKVILNNKVRWRALLETAWKTSGKYSAKLVWKAHANNSIRLKKVDVYVDLTDPTLGWDRYVTQYFRSETGLKKVEDISNYSKLNVEAVIKNGLSEGQSKDQITQRISDMYDKMSEGRAETIAKTEVNAATNYASLHTMKEYGNADMKTWMCLFENSREWHMEADGQTVPIDEQFDVGSESIDCPGDGGPENSVNCQCNLEYSTQQAGEGE